MTVQAEEGGYSKPEMQQRLLASAAMDFHGSNFEAELGNPRLPLEPLHRLSPINTISP